MDIWAVGEAYEDYVGRWSRPVAVRFIEWLGVATGSRWLDVGCGTGALVGAILGHAAPAGVCGVDPSEGFLDVARAHHPEVEFLTGDAQAIPLPDNTFDAVVSGLVLNFVPDPARAFAESVRVAKRGGGVVAAYVWDYAEGMGMMRHFWEAATAVDPAAATLDQGTRFPLCRPESLRDLWAPLADVALEAIDVPTVFADFDDFWRPFLGGQGAAPGYTMSLTEAHRESLREALRTRLPVNPNGSIHMDARAWAIRGRVR